MKDFYETITLTLSEQVKDMCTLIEDFELLEDRKDCNKSLLSYQNQRYSRQFNKSKRSKFSSKINTRKNRNRTKKIIE